MPDNQNQAQRGQTSPVGGRFGLGGELLLAIMPTLTILAVLFLYERLSRQIYLVSSLSSTAFLIYLDPFHSMNQIRTILIAQVSAAILGLATYVLLGPGYLSVAVAVISLIAVMIIFRAVHPPAVSTTLVFAFRAGNESDLVLFGMALGVILVMVFMEQSFLWVLDHLRS
jgi:CBS-domain-containing membrane protein